MLNLREGSDIPCWRHNHTDAESWADQLRKALQMHHDAAPPTSPLRRRCCGTNTGATTGGGTSALRAEFHGTLRRTVAAPRNSSESSQQSGVPKIRPRNSGVVLSVRICTAYSLAALGYWPGNWQAWVIFRRDRETGACRAAADPSDPRWTREDRRGGDGQRRRLLNLPTLYRLEVATTASWMSLWMRAHSFTDEGQ